jgi:uncharacterized protein (TIGR00266 family)
VEFEIVHDPSYSLLRADLGTGDELVAESDAMVSMSADLESETKRAGGFFSAFLRQFGGESFYVNQFSGPGTVSVAPTHPGEIRHHRLHNDTLILQSGAYLASSPSVSVRAKWGGLKTLFGGEGAILLEAQGTGDLFFNAFGHVYEVDVEGTYTCDSGHMVAFSPSLDYTLTSAGGLFSTLFSGEGLTFEFSGSGSLFMQTRSLSGLVDHVTPFLPNR